MIDFWFEYASTYSYLSACRIGPVARDAGVTIRYRPFLLGPIFAEQGWNDSPFNLFEAKGRHMWRDLERTSQSLGLPFRKPTVFPRNGLLAARVTLVAIDEGFADAFVPEVYRANFERDEDIGTDDVMSRIVESLGRDPHEVLDAALRDENKAALRKQTAEANARGIFGAPSFVVGGELFWGNDRLEQAIAWHQTC